MIANALRGVRVLDLSRILAGPWCTQNLADLGAEVIKIERPVKGDDTRGWGPPYLQSADGSEKMSAYFACCNRNKKSVCLDFKSAEDRAQLLAMAAEADILVENYRVGTLKQYGFDYESLRAINPRLIYASITGYGQTGPKAERPGYDYIFQGLGGLMSYTGPADGQPGAGPMRTGVAVVDITTGMYATSAVLAALYQRTLTGAGCHLDLALLDVAVAMNANQAANYLVSGKVPERTGNTHPNLAPYEVFQAADGYFILAAGNDAQFKALCEILGCPGLATDARFETNSARMENLDVLRAKLASLFITRPKKHWTDQLQARGISWGAVNNLKEVFEDEQVIHRKMFRVAQHHSLGDVPMVGNPMLAGEHGAPMRFEAPPSLGQHTEHSTH